MCLCLSRRNLRDTHLIDVLTCWCAVAEFRLFDLLEGDRLVAAVVLVQHVLHFACSAASNNLDLRPLFWNGRDVDSEKEGPDPVLYRAPLSAWLEMLRVPKVQQEQMLQWELIDLRAMETLHAQSSHDAHTIDIVMATRKTHNEANRVGPRSHFSGGGLS